MPPTPPDLLCAPPRAAFAPPGAFLCFHFFPSHSIPLECARCLLAVKFKEIPLLYWLGACGVSHERDRIDEEEWLCLHGHSLYQPRLRPVVAHWY